MSLPPGPQLPSLIQVGRWIVHPLRLLDECQRRYGDVFTWRAPRGRRFVIVADPELIKQVLTEDAETLLAGAGNAPLLEPILGKQSLLMLDGAEHLRQRRLLLPSFHGAPIQAFAATMREITEASLASWPLHRPFALHSFMQDITLDVIVRTVFGVYAGEPHRRLRTALVQLLDLSDNQWLLLPGMFGVDPFTIPWLRMTKLKRAVDDAIYEIIADRKRHPTGGTDVLSMMVTARDEQGRAMTDLELRDELVTLLIAGHETTATALAWTFDQLLSHPPALDRLCAELATDRTDYLDAVIRETLRVRPIVPLVGRVTARPYQLGRWLLPADTHIAPSIYLAGRRPDAYPDPDQFKPERWLGVKPDPYTWLPFGGGIRRCLGMAFALLEMRIVLQTVVPRTTMRLTDGPAPVVRRGITLTPAKGTRVLLTERRTSSQSQRATMG
ncbi:MAG: cytochrome P450 [Kofleriaceae bacterium]